MRQLIGRIALACCAGVGFPTSYAIADDGARDLQPYVGLDLGHSRSGQDLSVAVSGGLRWRNGFGLVLAATPLDSFHVESEVGGPGQESDLRAATMTTLARELRADWRHRFGASAWSVVPTVGWFHSESDARLQHPGYLDEEVFRLRNEGVVAGFALERTLGTHWRAELSARYYDRRSTELTLFQTEDDVHRVAVGLAYTF